MEKSTENQYVRRTQCDYSTALKIEVVQEVERGELSTYGAMRKYGIQSRATIVGWLRKYGTFDWVNQIPSNMPKSTDRKLLELEQKVKLLEKQKAQLESQVEKADKKAILFDMLIDLAEKEYNIPIRKNSSPEQSTTTEKKNKKPLSATCALFGIDRQVYYRQIKSRTKSQAVAQEVVDMVVQVRMRMPRIGTRKLYFILKNQLMAIGIGRDKLFAIMKANQMRIHPKRNYRVTTNSYHRFRKHADIVTGRTIVRPEQVWVSDITYVGTTKSYNYLALVTDAYSKKIVGYDLSNSLSTEGSLRALHMAVKGRMYPEEVLIHHSDRGLQYCSNDYQDLLKKCTLLCSMTTSYDPYSNAVAERVNGIIKNEFDLEKYKVDLTTLKKIVTETVEIYNTERPHFSCSMLTPSQMHQQNKVAMKTYKTKNRSKGLLASV